MNVVKKLAVLLSLGALLPLAVSAKTPEAAYVEAYPKSSRAPVPVAVVSPDVSADYAGTTVELAFTVDAKGTPTGFAVLSSPDEDLAKVMVDAVSKWRFAPAHKNGAAVATKVVLPVHVLDTGSRFAAD